MRALREMTLLISIDPGLSTGVAIFDGSCLVRSFTTKAPHTQLRVELQSLDETDEVLCERGPTNHRRQAATCEPVEAIVEACSQPVVWVRPTQWKRTPDAVLLPSDTPRTVHERDAIRLGRWRLARGWIGVSA